MAKNNPFKVTAVALPLLATTLAAPVYGFQYTSGDLNMQLDTTISIGGSWRLHNTDYNQVGTVNALAAQATGENPTGKMHDHGSGIADDADLLWKKNASFSELGKITMDWKLDYRDYGAFVRGKAFYDNRIMEGDGVTHLPAYYWKDDLGRNQLPKQSDGRSADILDAFVWGNWQAGSHPINARLGKQVINWGEGLLFANGINSINPVDVNALLAPGSEVKDALIPLNSIYASVGLTQSVTLESFALLEWKETVLPACGTFFSQTDLLGSGCWAGFVPNGWEPGYTGTVSGQTTPASAITLPRGKDITPDAHDQFGIALRIMADSIGTEFGLYFTQLNSNLPVVSGHTPDVTQFKYNGTPLPFSSLNAARSTLVGLTNNPLATIALLPYGDYAVEYPEGVKLFGASFSTTMNLGLPGGDTSVSGEISVRKDQPFAIEDGDALAGAVGLPSLSCANSPTPYDCYSEFSPGEYRPGYIKTDYYQAEMVFLQFFDQVLGADRWTTALDIAGSYLKMPNKKEVLLNSAYNATLNFPNMPDVSWTTPGVAGLNTLPYAQFIQMTVDSLASQGSLHNTVTRQDNGYPTSGAWGYKVRATGDYNNVFAGVNLRPTISFSQDVYGTNPSPITNFLQNRKALGLSLDAIYLNNYTVGVAYNDFFGAEPYNSMADRDYVTISASASF